LLDKPSTNQLGLAWLGSARIGSAPQPRACIALCSMLTTHWPRFGRNKGSLCYTMPRTY
jgi:hypothetical protein